MQFQFLEKEKKTKKPTLVILFLFPEARKNVFGYVLFPYPGDRE